MSTKDDVNGLYYEIKEALSEFRRTIDSLSSELEYMAGEAHAKAIYLLEQAKPRLSKLENDWIALDVQSQPAEEDLRAIQSDLSVAQSHLSILILRRIHHKFNGYSCRMGLSSLQRILGC